MEDGIIMPQPLKLMGGGSDTLLIPIRHVRCCMPVLAVLYWRLNMYGAYVANEVIPAWKWGLLRSDTASRRCCHMWFS
jgi:hypothetical protein